MHDGEAPLILVIYLFSVKKPYNATLVDIHTSIKYGEYIKLMAY